MSFGRRGSSVRRVNRSGGWSTRCDFTARPLSTFSIVKTASSVRVYLDSSALLKRVLDEPERVAFEAALDRFVADGAVLMSSSLAWVEVSRSLRTRLDREGPRRIIELIDVALSGIQECPMTAQVVSIAQRLGPASLRSLDVIHLASASLLGAELVCAYDQRLLTAAEELGFRTASPGLVTTDS